MLWESWVVLAIFVVNLAFLVIMSFVSPFYKQLLSRGVGKVFNIIWMCVIVSAAAVLMFYNVQCTVMGPGQGPSCKRLAISIVIFLTLLTILLMTWSIFNTIEYDKHNKKQITTQEQKK